MLSETEAQQIFNQKIIPVMLAGEAPPTGKPVATLLSAQPGAGKSVIARQIEESDYFETRPVLLDVDAFRDFYPDYRALLQQDIAGSQSVTQADARRWMSWSIDFVSENGLNAIIEHGFRNKEAFDEVIGILDSRSYEIHGALLATPLGESRLGVLSRYQTGIEVAGVGRYVNQQLQDDRYDHLETVAGWLADDARVSRVDIYTRGRPSPLYQFPAEPSPADPSPPNPVEALRIARNQRFSPERTRNFVRLQHSLTARMGKQWKPAIDTARLAAEPLLDPQAMTPQHDLPAITFGRYQVVSIAHLDTIRTILLDWPTVEIGILDLTGPRQPTRPIPSHLQNFYAECGENTHPSKNPLTASERVDIWRSVVDEAGLDGRVTINIIRRPVELTRSRGHGFLLVDHAAWEAV